MNIKKILLPLLILLSGYSFSVFAAGDYIKYKATGGYTGCIEYPFGNGLSQFKSNIVKKYGCISEHFRPVSVSSLTMINDYMGDIKLCGTAEWGETVCLSHGVSGSDAFCPEGFTFNEATGECLLEPDEPYCRSDEFLTQKESAEKSCFASGSQDFSYTCDDETSTHSFSCAPAPPEPGECTIDSPDYPACLEPNPNPDPCEPGAIDYPACLDDKECVPSQDNNWCDNPPCKIGYAGWPACEPWYKDDPFDPLEPPEKPEIDPGQNDGPKDIIEIKPPSQTPGQPYDDSGVIDAVQNLNRDMNLGFSDINGALQLQTNVLSSTNELVYQGLVQDLKMHDNQIANDNQNTDNIMGGLGGIGESINGLGDAIGNIKFEDKDDTDEASIIAAINELGKGMVVPCKPTKENNYCENPHGLDSNYVETIFTQMNESVDASVSAADSVLIQSANDFVETPPISSDEITPFVDDLIALLPDYSSCQPVSFFGEFLDCKPFEIFKDFFGWVLYILTIKSLVSILLTDMTPFRRQE